MSKKPVMLMILDGWGVAPASDVQEGPKGKDFENGEKRQERDILLFCLDAKMWHCE